MSAVLVAALVIGSAALLSWPLGRYMAWSMEPAATAGRYRDVLERTFVRVAGAMTSGPQDWKRYAVALLTFNAVMFALCIAVLASQQHLPLNPDGKGALEGSLVFHTAASFVTNTNLQHYSGEVALSHFAQLVALMWLQFTSAATGIAALAALARGLAGQATMGNFLVDLQRATFLVLLPLALLLAVLLVLGGVPMTLDGAIEATTLEGAKQVIARGPVAAFVAIKQLGTNGGGFFGPNSAHPFENPTAWTNGLSMVAILLVPMASVWMFGRIIGSLRHAGAVFGVMLLLLALKVGVAAWAETEPTPAFADLPVAQDAGNLEGKELRFAASGPVWATFTTSTSNGSVNAMHDSLNPLTGLVALTGMWLNATFGGAGVGMINMFVYIILTVFLAGMMVGRTPEYLNRRVEAHEVKLAALALLTHGALVLVGTAVFAVTPWGMETLANAGSHGFSEILYEFSSASANNGSGFEGLRDNTVPWNVATGLVMLLSRFIPIVLPLAIAASLSARRRSAPSAGTLGTDDLTFAAMLVWTILFLGALTFLPVAALGPVAEHLVSVG